MMTPADRAELESAAPAALAALAELEEIRPTINECYLLLGLLCARHPAEMTDVLTTLKEHRLA